MFITRLRTDCYAPDGSIQDGEFVLTAPLIWELAPNTRLIVPTHFITDFASIPKALHFMPGFDVNGRSRAASVLHDWLYCAQKEVLVYNESGELDHAPFSRPQADALFRDALLATNNPPIVAHAMYAAVRCFGWRYWDKRHDGLDSNYDFALPQDLLSNQ
jgi:hypothetical protein